MAELRAGLRDVFGAELPLKVVFEPPTLAAMSVAIAVQLVEQADAGTLAQTLHEVGCETVPAMADPE